MKLPAIIVNFKIYEQGTGRAGLELAKIHEKVAKETGASIGIAVSALDLAKIAEAVSIPVFAQNFDPVGYGGFTGHISAYQLKEAGAYGTLLNHAECRMENETIMKCIESAREVDLFTIVCAETPGRAGEILKHNPDLIAFEPPELIGGDISVSKAGPHLIEEGVSVVGDKKLLVGAGVRDPEDVQIGLSLGACGVLLASGVVKAADPYTALLALVSGLK